MAQLLVTLSDVLRVRSSLARRAATPVQMAEMLNLNDVPQTRRRLRVALRDQMRVTSASSLASVTRALLTSGLRLTGSLLAAHGIALRARMAVSEQLRAGQGVVLRDALRLRLQVHAVAAYSQSLHEAVRLADMLKRPGAGVTMLDKVSLRARMLTTYRGVARIADRLKVSDVLTPKLMIVALARDEVDFDDFTGVGSILRAALRDRIDFIVDTISSSGDVTTWAMNARTGAVSEYLNYGFNSFARSATGTYLAADDTGLYELVGPDDAGEPVISNIVSGLIDFGQTFLAGMQAAYLGIRGDGEIFLKLTQGDGRSTTYGVKMTSLRTARVNLGKGLRARWFTYELTSTGQDFDLLDVTFLPIQQTRRI